MFTAFCSHSHYFTCVYFSCVKLLNDKIFLDFNFHLLGFLCCSDIIKPLINFQAYAFAGEVTENL